MMELWVRDLLCAMCADMFPAVTEKVWESESTDDETERESKPAKIKKPGTARAKTGATKQSLISNFFRK